jgi:hypothetical protein
MNRALKTAVKFICALVGAAFFKIAPCQAETVGHDKKDRW